MFADAVDAIQSVDLAFDALINQDDVFDRCGFFMSGASWPGCDCAWAACAMVGGPWHGDPVVFVGDYWEPHKSSGETSRRVGGLFDGYPYEDILNNFRNVTGLFKEAEGKLYPDYLNSKRDAGVIDKPYESPFELEVRRCAYAVNRTRREYVDFSSLPVDDFFRDDRGGYSWSRRSPIPTLFSLRT